MVNNLSFILKYWLPLFVICSIYVIVVTCICYSVNLKNDTLEKRSGIIEDFKMDITPVYAWTWYIMNFKIEGDTTTYAQEWRIINFSLLNHFLLENREVYEGSPYNKGAKIEFYKDKSSQNYPYFIVDNIQNMPHKGKYILKKSENMNIIRTYGLVIDNKVIFDFTKRGFATPLLGNMMIGLLILSIPLLLITLIYINALLGLLIDKLPFKI